jgi:hypothetical protein
MGLSFLTPSNQEVVEAGESIQAAADGSGRKILFSANIYVRADVHHCPFSIMGGPRSFGLSSMTSRRL